MLDIVASYHCMQFQGNLMIQTQENDKKTLFGPDLVPLGSKSGREFLFCFVFQKSGFIMHIIRKKLISSLEKT